MQLVQNYGCTLKSTDPNFLTLEHYDFSYIENTVYRLASEDTSLGHQVKIALNVIEKAYADYG